MKLLTDEQIKSNIAANARRLLATRKWTQKELSEAADVPQMTVSVIVRGSHMPGVGILSRIAEALDVTIDRLIADPPGNNSRRSA